MLNICTYNIEISVEVKYWPQHSIPGENHFFFVYFITIHNKNNFAVQLIRRHWNIFDSNGDHRTVDGEGVVGETPVLEPGEMFKYNSGCNLSTELGYMKGFYTMVRQTDNKVINVEIPKFDLVVPAKLN
jgi:ApaG protein